ncbi:unnamed protein product [Rodentolepis nana]|uniref:Uncharacterized protein n=1 Tax=Rodentolepis nana TaxID=102285 RepID=A0A0R3THY4_RODNA|nr:unnamed protein product [Rodentolepis nana]
MDDGSACGCEDDELDCKRCVTAIGKRMRGGCGSGGSWRERRTRESNLESLASLDLLQDLEAEERDNIAGNLFARSITVYL